MVGGATTDKTYKSHGQHWSVRKYKAGDMPTIETGKMLRGVAVSNVLRIKQQCHAMPLEATEF